MNFKKFVDLVKQTGWLRVFPKENTRLIDGEVHIKSGYEVDGPIAKQYMLLGDEEGMKELKDQENLSEVRRDPTI